MKILDIHTHRPSPEGILSLEPAAFRPSEYADGQLFSVGIHPWSTLEEPSETVWNALEQAVALPQVVAVGECGVDTLKGGPMFRQLLVMRRQIELSEKVGKPLIIHDVKAHDVIVGLRKDLRPSQPWIIHGFRGKQSVMKMLLDAGCMISFGEKYNEESLRAVPADRYLAETDESPLPIEEIIARHAATLATDPSLLIGRIAANTAPFIPPQD